MTDFSKLTDEELNIAVAKADGWRVEGSESDKTWSVHHPERDYVRIWCSFEEVAWEAAGNRYRFMAECWRLVASLGKRFGLEFWPDSPRAAHNYVLDIYWNEVGGSMTVFADTPERALKEAFLTYKENTSK